MVGPTPLLQFMHHHFASEGKKWQQRIGTVEWEACEELEEDNGTL